MTGDTRQSSGAMLGVDLGTTHCKAGLFDLDGSLLGMAVRPTPLGQDHAGRPYHDPERLWRVVIEVIREAVCQFDPRSILALGVAGMAEAGLLVDRCSGEPRSEIIPWFDPRSTPQAEEIVREDEPRALFARTGLRHSPKYGLAKLLWLRAQNPDALNSEVWLSVPDYIVFRLTGRMATDPTLAARTLAYRIDRNQWDLPWIHDFGLEAELFPEVLPSGASAGTISPEAGATLGLALTTLVSVAGHDHICAGNSKLSINPMV